MQQTKNSNLSQSLSRFVEFSLVTDTEMGVEVVNHAAGHVHKVGPGHVALKNHIKNGLVRTNASYLMLFSFYF